MGGLVGLNGLRAWNIFFIVVAVFSLVLGFFFWGVGPVHIVSWSLILVSVACALEARRGISEVRDLVGREDAIIAEFGKIEEDLRVLAKKYRKLRKFTVPRKDQIRTVKH